MTETSGAKAKKLARVGVHFRLSLMTLKKIVTHATKHGRSNDSVLQAMVDSFELWDNKQQRTMIERMPVKVRGRKARC